MTLLKQFNEKLKELPDISRKLEATIIMGEWPDEKKQQAITIIDQIKNVGSIESVGYLPYNYITAVPLKITLSPRECGIDKDILFKPKNIIKADNYIRELLADINNISEDVKFSLAGHNYEGEECEFFID